MRSLVTAHLSGPSADRYAPVCAHAAIANGNEDVRVIGTYVSAPLTWAVSTGAASKHTDLSTLQGATMGISRLGSGSHLMAVVMAYQAGWLAPSPPPSPPTTTSAAAASALFHANDDHDSEDEDEEERAAAAAVSEAEGGGEEQPLPLSFCVLRDFEGLRHGVNHGLADAFLWETFTTKVRVRVCVSFSLCLCFSHCAHVHCCVCARSCGLCTLSHFGQCYWHGCGGQPYHDSKEVRRIGQVRAPWAAFLLAARRAVVDADSARIRRLLDAISVATARFMAEAEDGRSQAYVAGMYGQRLEDVGAWLRTVAYPADAATVARSVLTTCVHSLRKARLVRHAVAPAALVDARVARLTSP
jgi:hypothetical protein